MNKDFIKGINISLGILLVFSVVGIVSAVGFHYANEILPGTFTGNYKFAGDVNITTGNDLCIEGDKCLSAARVSSVLITSADLADNSVTSSKIVNGAVTSADLADNSVTTSKILDGTIINADIANNAINSVKILDGSITSADLAANSVGSLQIVDGTIGSADINSAQVQRRVTGTCPAGQSIRAISATGTVTCEVDDVGTFVLSANSIDSSHIIDGSITNADIGNNAINSIKIVDGSITSADIANNAVTSAKILDGTIVNADIANNAINSIKIIDGSITSADLAANSVGSLQIVDGSIGSADINSAQVQRRVSGTCPAGQSIRAISSTGTVTCEVDDVGTITCPCGTCWATSTYLCGCDNYYELCTPVGWQKTGPASCFRCSCFAAETSVLMSDGSYRNIEDVKIGDRVASLDGYNTVVDYDRPLLTFEKNQRLMSINGGDFFITDNHPVMTTEGWKSQYPESAESEAWDILHNNISKLEIGDEIILSDGSKLVVESLELKKKSFTPQKLYNFVLDGDNTYYANDMLVLGFVPDKAGMFPIEKEH